MDEDLGPLVGTVVVSNARWLNVSEKMCVNITVKNVAQVVTEKGEGDSCKVNIKLSARNSTLDRLPNWTSQVYLEDSNIISLSTNASVTQLTVINSAIKVVNISQPLPEGASATFVSVDINTLQRLSVEGGSDVFFYKSNISVLSSEGLLLSNGGTVTLRDSSTASVSEDSVVISPGATLSLENYTGSLTVKATTTMNATSAEPEKGTFQLPCDCNLQNTYFRVFIAMLILFLCLSIVTVFTGLSLKRKKTRSRASLRSLSGLIRQKVKEVSTDDFGTLLLQREIGCDHLLALEKLRYRIVSSLHTEKLLHQTLVAEIDRKFETGLLLLHKDTQDKRTYLESSKMTELRQTQEMFNQEIGKPTCCHRDEVRYVLEQRKAEQENLIHEKTKEKIYDVEHRDTGDKLEHKAGTVRENKELMMKLANLGRQTLFQWRKIIDSSDVSLEETPASRKLLSLVERLLHARQNDMEHKYERQIEEQDKIYLSDMKIQEKKFVEKCAQLEKSYKECCSKITDEHKKQLTTTTCTEELHRDRLEELYEIKTRVQDVKLSLDMKKAQDRYSGVDIRLRHLDSVVKLQKGHMEDMEELITMIMNAQKLYVKALRQSLSRPNGEKFRGEGDEELRVDVEEETMNNDSYEEEEEEEEDGVALHRHVEDLCVKNEE